MNKTIETQLNHRTIRFFKAQAVEQDRIDTYLKVMNQTASSTGAQTCSLIRVTQADLKQKVAAICNQAYVAQAPELWLFLVDNYRNSQIAKAQGYEGDNFRNMDMFFQGVSDAILAAQNVNLAIESDGLGAVFLGSILNDVASLIELFKLPELTFPILGLAFGYPDDQPQLKPRMPLAYKVGENAYPMQADYLSVLAEYDQTMTTYYDTRMQGQRSDNFTKQIYHKMLHVNPKRVEILRYIKQQGFKLNL